MALHTTIASIQDIMSNACDDKALSRFDTLSKLQNISSALSEMKRFVKSRPIETRIVAMEIFACYEYYVYDFASLEYSLRSIYRETTIQPMIQGDLLVERGKQNAEYLIIGFWRYNRTVLTMLAIIETWASDVAEQAMSLLSSRLEKPGRDQYEGCTVFDVALRHSIRKELEIRTDFIAELITKIKDLQSREVEFGTDAVGDLFDSVHLDSIIENYQSDAVEDAFRSSTVYKKNSNGLLPAYKRLRGRLGESKSVFSSAFGGGGSRARSKSLVLSRISL